MKTRIVAILAAALMMFSASFALAGISVGNTDTVTTTGGAASSDQTQTEKQKQEEQQKQNASAVVYGNLPEVGFVGFLPTGTPIVGTEWKFYYSSLYARLSVKKIDKMRYGFHFSDLWPGKWGGRVQFTPEGERLQENKTDIELMQYWPEGLPPGTGNAGDEVLGSVIVVGEPDWSDQAFLGDAAYACKTETMTRRIAVSEAEYIDGVTVGASIGLSGSTAEASNGAGFVIASGAMVGKNKTRAERVRRFKVLCMNDGPLYLPPCKKETPKTEPTPVKSVEPEKEKPCQPKCDVSVYERIVAELQESNLEHDGIRWCKWPGRNNESLRFRKGTAYEQWYFCERSNGKRKEEVSYLLDLSDNEFGAGERDYFNGRELTAEQNFGDKPMGVQTTTVLSAQEVMYKIYRNWSLVVLESQGMEAEIELAQRANLRNNGDHKMSTVPADIKH